MNILLSTQAEPDYWVAGLLRHVIQSSRYITYLTYLGRYLRVAIKP